MADREIKIRLTADGNYTKTVVEADRATDDFNRSTDKARRNVDRFGKSTDTASVSMRTLGRAAAVAGGAVAAIFTAQQIQASIRYASAIGRTADILGLSSQALQEQQFAFERSGGQAEEYLDILNTLQVAIGDAMRGSATQKDALDALGIAYTDASGRGRDAVEVLEELIVVQANMTNETERAAQLDELLGESSRQLLAINREKAASFADLADQADEYGAVLSDSAIVAAREASREAASFARVLDTTLAEAFTLIAPAVSVALEALTLFVGKIGEGIRWAREFFGLFDTEAQKLRAANVELEKQNAQYDEWITKIREGTARADELHEIRNTLNAAGRTETELMQMLVLLYGENNAAIDENNKRIKELNQTNSQQAQSMGRIVTQGEKVVDVYKALDEAGEAFRIQMIDSARSYDQAIAALDLAGDEFARQFIANQRAIEEQNRSTLISMTGDWARFFNQLDDDWGRALGSILQGVSSITAAMGQWSGAGFLGRLGIIGSIAGAGVGLFQALFGGDNNPPSPEIAIGGPATTTGQVAGTQAVSAFGRFGLRDPRGADPATELRAIAQSIVATENRIASFLTAGQIGAVQAAGRVELLADSDRPEEVSNIVNQWFLNTLKAIDTTLADIFDAETIGGLLDPAIGGAIAESLIELSDAFDRLSLSLSAEFVESVGGAQEALRLTNNYMERFFRPDEIAQIQLERANNVVREQFGDLVDTYGINMNNFREIFEEVSPEGEELGRWLRLAEALGIADDALQNYNQSLAESETAAESAADAIQQVAVSTAQLTAEEQNLLSTRLTAFDLVNASMRDLRVTVRDLERGNQSLLQTYISEQAEINFLITTLVTGVDGLAVGITEFTQSVAAIVNFIDGTIASINQSIARQQLDIGLDALATDQQRYDFLQDYIDEQTNYLAGLTDPQEIARVTGDIQTAVARQWALLPESERQRLGGDFITFLDSLGIESTGLLGETRDMVITNANLTIQAATVRIEGLQDDPGQATKDMNKAGFDMVFASKTMMRAANKINATFQRGIKVSVKQSQAQNG